MRRLVTVLLMLIGLAACQSAPETPTPTGPTATVNQTDAMATEIEYMLATVYSIELTPTSTPSPQSPIVVSPTSSYHPTPLPNPTPSLPVADGGPIPDGAFARLGIGSIRAASLSPDGQFIAVGTTVGLYMYRSADFERLWAKLVERPVSGIVWSPDGRMIAVWPQDGHFASVIAASTSVQVARFEHSTDISSADWSPDSRRLVLGWGGGGLYTEQGEPAINPHITVWDVAAASEIFSSESHAENTIYATGVESVAWSPDGRLIAGAFTRERDVSDPYQRRESLVTVWSADTGEVLNVITHDYVQFLAFSPDGSLLATWSGDTGTDAPYGSREVYLWDATTGTLVRELQGHTGYVYAAAWSPDGTLLATGSWGEDAGPTGQDASETIVWEAETGSSLTNVVGTEGGFVQALSWSPDGSRIVSGTYSYNSSGEIYLWEAEADGVQAYWLDHRSPIIGIEWMPDSSSFVSVSGDLIALRDSATGQPLRLLPASDPCDVVVGVNFFPLESPTASFVSNPCSHETYIIYWEEGSYSPQPVSIQLNQEYFEPDLGDTSRESPDETLSARVEVVDDPFDTIPPRTIVTVVNNSSGAILYEFEGPPANGLILEWSPDGTMLAAAGGLDPQSMFDDYVSGWEENAVMVWDVTTGQLLHRFLGHTGRVFSLGWPLGRSVIISGSADGTVILWDVSR